MTRLTSWLLNVVYLAIIAFASPLVVWQSLRTGKYREGYREKLLGLVPKRNGGATCIWIHAVSVGEVNLVTILLRELRAPIPIGNSSFRRPAAPATNWPARSTPISASSTAHSISVGPSTPRCAASGRPSLCLPNWNSGPT